VCEYFVYVCVVCILVLEKMRQLCVEHEYCVCHNSKRKGCCILREKKFVQVIEGFFFFFFFNFLIF
jgi:hypothetical protein